ncbi:MAG: hypothetical protein KAV87_41935 [Desulfobacteraceae bacterium]|nr:hypothetical protein [Desulfobacteraceae bacterium]
MEVLKSLLIVVPWVLVALLMVWFCIKELHQLCLTKRLKSVALVGIILYFFSPLWLWGIFSFISIEILSKFFIAWVVLWVLIWLFFSFYGAYSTGVDNGCKAAENPQHKTIEIRDTWPSHICHASQTIFLLSLVIFFFPWFIVYRLGKWKGRKKYCVLDKKWKEENAKRARMGEQKKYTPEYYDNPNDHIPNAYGYTDTDKQ